MAVEAFYCSCGSSWKVSWRAKREPPAMPALRMIRAEHLADGHVEVDAKACAAARRKNERLSLKWLGA